MNPHLADDVVAALIDEQLAPAELHTAQLHLAACPECQANVEQLRTVVGLLHQLPDVAPPRSFVLGPRAVADPPNVIRLRRWYAATRIAAGSLAAGFVLLAASTLYLDSRPAKTAEVLSAAPAAQVRDAAKPAAPPVSAPTSAPAAAKPAAGAAAPAPAAALASRPAQNATGAADASDQVAAATSVRPLPTQPPTPIPVVAPTAAPVAARIQAASQLADDPAPLRLGAVAFGLLAALALLGAVLVRHRLQQATSRS